MRERASDDNEITVHMVQSSCAGGDGLHRTGLSVGMCLYPGPSSTSTHKVVNTAKEVLAKNDMEPPISFPPFIGEASERGWDYINKCA